MNRLEEEVKESKMAEEESFEQQEKREEQETSPTGKKKEKKPKLDKEKEKLKSENLELKEKVLRITAEMQNMRRRYDADIANMYKYDGFDLAEKILPIIDNFERALKIKSEENEKFLDGFKMIYENLISILTAKGIKEIEAQGKNFDPTMMNAVMTEVNNEVEENMVLDVLQKGYMYNDKLIRPAMVKVSERESE